MKVTVLESRREELQKMVGTFERKAQKYGQSIKAEFGSTYTAKQTFTDDITKMTSTFVEEVFDIEIEAEEIRCGNYSVIAKIDHLAENKNVVFTFGIEAKQDWFTVGCKCDHCMQKRSRKTTYIVSDGVDEKQIGSSCLKDYSGIDPEYMVLKQAFEESVLLQDVDHYEMSEEDHYNSDCYNVERMLSIAIKAIDEQGYRPSSEPYSNKKYIINHCFDNEIADEAKEIVEYFKSLNDAVNSFDSNLNAICTAGYCKAKHFGYIAYAPMAYRKAMEKIRKQKELEENKESEAKASEYVGEVGQRIEVVLKSMVLLTSWDNGYGFTFLYKMVDENDNVLVWKASNPVDCEDVKTIKGTIKEHSEYDGVKQTVLTRCKVAA